MYYAGALGPGGKHTTIRSRLVVKVCSITYGGYISIIDTISQQQQYYHTMSSLILYIFYSMGFLEYSGPKAGDREPVTGSEVLYGDWWE